MHGTCTAKEHLLLPFSPNIAGVAGQAHAKIQAVIGRTQTAQHIPHLKLAVHGGFIEADEAISRSQVLPNIIIRCDVRQIDFSAKVLIVGKSKTQTGTGRAIPLNARILNVLEMWAAQFSDRQSNHYVFPFEKCGAKGELDRFGFTAGVIIYDTDPTRPVGDWKEAWEKAKERAGVILRGESQEPQPTRQEHKCQKSGTEPKKKSNGKGETKKPEPLKCRFHDLRHTAVTRLLEAGIAYPVVASMMGWSAATAIRMANRYGHIGSQALREAAEVLGHVKVPAESLKKSPKSIEVRNAAIQ